MWPPGDAAPARRGIPLPGVRLRGASDRRPFEPLNVHGMAKRTGLAGWTAASETGATSSTTLAWRDGRPHPKGSTTTEATVTAMKPAEPAKVRTRTPVQNYSDERTRWTVNAMRERRVRREGPMRSCDCRLLEASVMAAGGQEKAHQRDREESARHLTSGRSCCPFIRRRGRQQLLWTRGDHQRSRRLDRPDRSGLRPRIDERVCAS